MWYDGLSSTWTIKSWKDDNHILWLKILNRCRKLGNGLGITVLPQNPLRQVMSHPFFAGHDPSGVPAYVLKSPDVSSILVRPRDDINILHQINEASVVSIVTAHFSLEYFNYLLCVFICACVRLFVSVWILFGISGFWFKTGILAIFRLRGILVIWWARVN